MQHLTILISKTANWYKKLKQKLAFIIILEQYWVKQLAIFHKVKKFNAAIKKNLAVHKTSLYAQQDNNNEDIKLILLAQVAFVSAFILINIININNNNNNNNFDNKKNKYVNVFINCNS